MYVPDENVIEVPADELGRLPEGSVALDLWRWPRILHRPVAGVREGGWDTPRVERLWWRTMDPPVTDVGLAAGRARVPVVYRPGELDGLTVLADDDATLLAWVGGRRKPLPLRTRGKRTRVAVGRGANEYLDRLRWLPDGSVLLTGAGEMVVRDDLMRGPGTVPSPAWWTWDERVLTASELVATRPVVLVHLRVPSLASY